MDIHVSVGNIARAKTNVIVLNIFEDAAGLEGDLAEIDRLLGGSIAQLVASGEIKGKFKELTTIYTLGKMESPKIVIAGLGKKAELTPEKIRVAVAELCRTLRQKSAEIIDSVAHGITVTGLGVESIGQAIAEGALLGTYTFRKYMTKAPEYKEIQTLEIIASDSQKVAALEKGCRKGQIIAEATVMARDLVNEPANTLTPAALAKAAQDLAQKYDLIIEVFDKEQLQNLKMGGLLGVAQGSQQPPKFIVLKYQGKDTGAADIALVGKGITFDSGGISIKPSEHMGDMKGDMAGGAAVMGAIAAIALLKPKINVAAIIPATENMPGGTAMRPGDVITIMNGKTVEIITTDAEGRLILADALSYAEKIGALKIVDVATLTGACQVALGNICTGAFGNNQELVNQIIDAGAEAGECMWQLPMNDEYKELNKSDVADIKNSGGRYGGAISAAWFLREFVEKIPWVHLDIAGTSDTDKEKGYLVKGATGVPVRTLVNLVLSLADKNK
ncbi:MAG TPA: leucyl aminopeptidase [Dehalococcoidales bacterium]